MEKPQTQSADTKCAFCGTVIPGAYTVCSGCGANFRTPRLLSALASILSFPLVIMAIAIFSDDKVSQSTKIGLFVAVFAPLGFLLLRMFKAGNRRNWYRRNA